MGVIEVLWGYNGDVMGVLTPIIWLLYGGVIWDLLMSDVVVIRSVMVVL